MFRLRDITRTHTECSRYVSPGYPCTHTCTHTTHTHAHWPWSFCLVRSSWYAYMYTHTTHAHTLTVIILLGQVLLVRIHVHTYHTRTHTDRDHYVSPGRLCWWTDRGPCRAPRTCSRWRRSVRTRRNPPPGWCRPRRLAAPGSAKQNHGFILRGSKHTCSSSVTCEKRIYCLVALDSTKTLFWFEYWLSRFRLSVIGQLLIDYSTHGF